MINTTINIHFSNLIKINKASEFTGETRNTIIVILLRRAMLDSRTMIRLNRSVEYQEKDRYKRWHKFHVLYNEDVYEFCQDMRKIYKMSVSCILAYSVKKYLKIVIKDLLYNNNSFLTDNYPYSGFIFTQEFVDGAVLWQFTWGIPIELEKIFFQKY